MVIFKLADVDIEGTCRVGTLSVSRSVIETRLGPPNEGATGDGKSFGEWHFEGDDGSIVTLYRHKGDRVTNVDLKQAYSIGGYSEDDANNFIDWFASLT